MSVINQVTWYASQHIWCLSEVRINWEGCGRKGIRWENFGISGMGFFTDQFSGPGTAVSPMCVCLLITFEVNDL